MNQLTKNYKFSGIIFSAILSVFWSFPSYGQGEGTIATVMYLATANLALSSQTLENGAVMASLVNPDGSVASPIASSSVSNALASYASPAPATSPSPSVSGSIPMCDSYVRVWNGHYRSGASCSNDGSTMQCRQMNFSTGQYDIVDIYCCMYRNSHSLQYPSLRWGNQTCQHPCDNTPGNDLCPNVAFTGRAKQCCKHTVRSAYHPVPPTYTYDFDPQAAALCVDPNELPNGACPNNNPCVVSGQVLVNSQCRCPAGQSVNTSLNMCVPSCSVNVTPNYIGLGQTATIRYDVSTGTLPAGYSLEALYSTGWSPRAPGSASTFDPSAVNPPIVGSRTFTGRIMKSSPAGTVEVSRCTGQVEVTNTPLPTCTINVNPGSSLTSGDTFDATVTLSDNPTVQQATATYNGQARSLDFNNPGGNTVQFTAYNTSANQDVTATILVSGHSQPVVCQGRIQFSFPQCSVELTNNPVAAGQMFGATYDLVSPPNHQLPTGYAFERLLPGADANNSSNWVPVGQIGDTISTLADSSYAPGITVKARTRNQYTNQSQECSANLAVISLPPPTCSVAINPPMVTVGQTARITYSMESGPYGNQYVLEAQDDNGDWSQVSSGDHVDYTGTSAMSKTFRARSRNLSNSSVSPCEGILMVMEPPQASCMINLSPPMVIVGNSSEVTYTMDAGVYASSFVLEVPDGSGGWSQRSSGFHETYTSNAQGSINFTARTRNIRTNTTAQCNSTLMIMEPPQASCVINLSPPMVIVGNSSEVTYTMDAGVYASSFVLEVPDGSGGWSQRSSGFHWTYTSTAQGSINFTARTRNIRTNTTAQCSSILMIQEPTQATCIISLNPPMVSVNQATTVIYTMDAGAYASSFVLEVPDGSGGWSQRSSGFSWSYTATTVGSINFSARTRNVRTNTTSPCQSILMVNSPPQ